MKATIVNTQVKAREEQERTGSIVHDLRKDKRDLRQDNDSLKRQIADARKDNAYHLEMSNRLQQQLDAVIAEQGAEMLTPYKRKGLLVGDHAMRTIIDLKNSFCHNQC